MVKQIQQPLVVSLFSIIKKTLIYTMNIILISSIIIIFVGYINKFQEKYPTTRLKLSGQLDYIAPIEIESSLSNLLSNNLWTINVNTVKDIMYANPWVHFVFVNKHWPDILQVEVVQHNPIARWNDEFFLTLTGKVLYSTSENSDSVKNLNLPKFYGQNGQENLLINTYLTLLEKLAPVGLFILKMEIIEAQGIQVKLTNNVILKLGTFDLPDRIDRFILAYKKKLQPSISDISYIDLRYTNGMAVSWASKDTHGEERFSGD